MHTRFLTGVIAIVLSLLGLTAVLPAQAALAARVPPIKIITLRGAYLRALPHTHVGRIESLAYPFGRRPKTSRTGPACAQPCPVTYHGGAVQHHQRVYLLFWGPNWNSDPAQEASTLYLEHFYGGLGSEPADTWSLITSQYGDGNGYPSFSGSALAGAWLDTSTPPTGVSATQLGAEADALAQTVGISDLPDAQVVVATQSGTCPYGFYAPGCAGGTGTYCAWHSSTSMGETFTNLPFQPDAGSSCGANRVQGVNDGFSIVGGHEYAETITDPFSFTGWWDSAGEEVGDKCAWIDISGVTLDTGTFAMQPIWSNNQLASGGSGCPLSGPAEDTVTVNNPGTTFTHEGTSTSVQIQAASSSGATLAYDATGLPPGMTMDASTGLISGTPTTPGSYNVTVGVSDPTGASGSTTFSWAIEDTITLTDPGNQSGAVSTPVSLQLQASSSSGATLTYDVYGLPPGLTVNTATGLISGTPTTTGSYSVLIDVSDTTAAAAAFNITWTIGGAVSVTSPGNRTTYTSAQLSLQVKGSSSGGYPLTWSATGLPSGLSISSSTGKITGQIAGTGTFNVIVSAQDQSGASGNASFTWVVKPDVGTPVGGNGGLCLDDWQSRIAKGNRVDAWVCNGTGAQMWKLSSSMLHVLGQCLTDPGSGGVGTGLVIQPCKGYTTQLWTHRSNGEYVVGINGLCLTEVSINPGYQVDLTTCTGSASQKWSGS